MLARDQQGEERAGRAEREREQDDDRVQVAVELRRQYHVGHEHAEDERDPEAVEGLLERLRASGEDHAVTLGQDPLAYCLHRGKSLALGAAGRDVGEDADRALAVLARDREKRVSPLERGDRGEGDDLADVVPDPDPVD